jgi:hypothetical protein
VEGAILVHFSQKGSDLAFSDFHMFDQMKDAPRGRFSSDEEVISFVSVYLQ